MFAAAETPASDISKLGPLTGSAQPLSVTEKGVDIDGNLQAPGGGGDGYDFTLYYDIAEAKITGNWCDARAAVPGSVNTHLAHASVVTPAIAALLSKVLGMARGSSPIRFSRVGMTRQTWVAI